MPPKRAARSSSRSRAAMTPESTSRKASPVKSRSRGRPSKKDSEKKAGRPASKSASRRSASKSRVASRSRSSSRSRKVLATPSSAPASTSRKTPKERKQSVEVTAEVADDDDEIYTPRLRRAVRNLTQEPPRTRSRVPSQLKTFPADAVSAPKSQSCSILTCAKTKTVAAFNCILAVITTILIVLKRLILLPFQQLSDNWKRVKPADSRLAALLLVLILVASTAALAYFHPTLVQKVQLVGEKHVAVHFRHARQVVGTKYTKWSTAFVKWVTPKLEAVGLLTKSVQFN